MSLELRFGQKQWNGLILSWGLPVEQPGKDEDQHRDAGIDQHRVDGGGVLHGLIEERIESGDAEDALEEDEPAMPVDQDPLLAEMSMGQKPENEQGHRPSPEGQRHRRNGGMHAPAEDKVAGPEQGGEDQQKIRHAGRLSVRLAVGCEHQ